MKQQPSYYKTLTPKNYQPVLLKKTTQQEQEQYETKDRQESSFIVKHEEIEPLELNPEENFLHEYSQSVETIQEEEHNYFTASFQNMCCQYPTNQENDNDTQTESIAEEIEDTLMMMDDRPSKMQTLMNTNQKINQPLNPRLLNSKNTNYTSSQDYQDSQQSQGVGKVRQGERSRENNADVSGALYIIDEQESFSESLRKSFRTIQQDSLQDQGKQQKLQNSKSSNAIGFAEERQRFYASQNQNKQRFQRSVSPNNKTSPTPRFDKAGSEQDSSFQEHNFSTSKPFLDTQQNKSYQTNHSQLLSIGHGFFIQQNDKFMGTLNNFVEFKMNSLQYMIQEKRRVQQALDERKLFLKQTRMECTNQQKQQDLHKQELKLCQDKYKGLIETIEDLANNIKAVREKFQEKNEDYELQFHTLSRQAHDSKRQFNLTQENLNNLREKSEQTKQVRQKQIKDLSDQIKQAENRCIEVRKKKDLLQVNEKNRITYLKEKGCSVMKLIQEDKIYSDKIGSQAYYKSVQKTPNNRFTKLEIVPSILADKSNQSYISCKTTRGTSQTIDKRFAGQSPSCSLVRQPSDQKVIQQISCIYSHNGNDSLFTSKMQSCDLSESSGDYVNYKDKMLLKQGSRENLAKNTLFQSHSKSYIDLSDQSNLTIQITNDGKIQNKNQRGKERYGALCKSKKDLCIINPEEKKKQQYSNTNSSYVSKMKQKENGKVAAAYATVNLF